MVYDVNYHIYIYPFFILNKIREPYGYLGCQMGIAQEIYKRKFVCYVYKIFSYETTIYRIFETINFFMNFYVYICFFGRTNNYV